jgi:hypothetical protein
MASDKPKKDMPKGVRKGGTRYPRYTLAETITWARKLVSKTHLGAQPQDIIFASVVDSKSTAGEIRVSALKQYGLMQGPSKAYEATPLAKAIVAAPVDELPTLLSQAALSPPIFKSLFDTFHGDEFPRAKIRQRAADLQVHPDQADQCVDIYVAALEFSGLGSVNGDKISHRPAAAPVNTLDENSNEDESDQANEAGEDEHDPEADDIEEAGALPRSATPRAVFHVNVNLDASLDTEKLQKQLQLLKRFGAI